MKLTKKEETKKEFTEKEWAKFDRRKRNQLRKELTAMQKKGFVARLQSKGFFEFYDYNYRHILAGRKDLDNFIYKRTKLVLMEFPKTN